MMTRNITMAIEEKLLKKSKKIALEKNTTVTGLIRDYLTQLTEKEELRKRWIVKELEELFDRSKAQVGKKNWTRDDLYR
ncbi:hypothetical protein GF406_04610 [candidate division KSB1 bacterium]|nr:hypothetical protein [candidate division KSB1 bacterium]